MATADWQGLGPESGSMTRYTMGDHVWARRRVRADGTVLFMGHRFRPKPDVQIMPEPGEWLLFFNYGATYDKQRGPICGEWTSPPDPDGYIRRMFWELADGELQ